jgi:hypothetical protein
LRYIASLILDEVVFTAGAQNHMQQQLRSAPLTRFRDIVGLDSESFARELIGEKLLAFNMLSLEKRVQEPEGAGS